MKIAFKYERSDGFILAGAATDDSVELYSGKGSFTVVELNYKAAISLLAFLARWWMRSAFGLLPRIQQFRLARRLDRQVARGDA